MNDRPAAPSSADITWDELTARTSSNKFTVGYLLLRLNSLRDDPGREFFTLRQSEVDPIGWTTNRVD